MPIPFKLEHVIEQILKAKGKGEQRLLKELTGVRLPQSEAYSVWPRILEHKWYISERLGRDAGLRVAAIDYLENIRPPHISGPAERPLPPRLRMMMPLNMSH